MNPNIITRIAGNVAAFIPYPYKGGLQEYAIELSRRLGLPLIAVASSNRFIQTEIEDLFRTFNNLHVLYTDVEIFRNPILINLNGYKELKKVLKEFDVIHFHGPFPITGDFVLKGLIYVFTYHFDIELTSPLANTIARLYEGLMLRRTLQDAKVITVTSNFFIEESRLLRDFRRKIKILPLGINARDLTPTYQYLDKVTFIGRIIPEKGVHVLLNAFKKLAAELMDLELYIIGRPVDINYYNYLKTLAKSNRIEKKVHFTGYLKRDEMLRLLASSSALVLPSLTRLDSFGIVVLEASALAVPVVVSNVIPGAKEFIEKARNGFLVRPNNVDDLVMSIKAVLQNPKEFGERGRHYAVTHHDWSVIIHQICNIFSELVIK
ncbi:MAG: glycosyltransferase family 4 protein [Nitrososphaeria archaeon]